MKYLLGFLCGVVVATAYPLWAECCSGFNVPLDTQIKLDRRATWERVEREPLYVPEWKPYALPCEK